MLQQVVITTIIYNSIKNKVRKERILEYIYKKKKKKKRKNLRK